MLYLVRYQGRMEYTIRDILPSDITREGNIYSELCLGEYNTDDTGYFVYPYTQSVINQLIVTYGKKPSLISILTHVDHPYTQLGVEL